MPKSDPPSYTCRYCGMTSFNINDVRWQFCGACKKYGYEVDNPKTKEAAQPIQLDLIVADIHRAMRIVGGDSRCSILLEQFLPPGEPTILAHRAVALIDGKPQQHSRRAQASPQDALRELYHLCTGTKPEDI